MSFDIRIPDGANFIIQTLKFKGHTAYVVGGCVRDSIMGRDVHDWDLCTSATPIQVKEIFKDYKVIETGLKHGTVTIAIDGEQYECTTYRIDGEYSDGRHPDNVIFADNIVEDLKRRDFTINAMAYNDEDGLIDPFHGRYDIERKIIRCVGSPRERFEEDALRIMRALRFAAQLEFDISANTAMEMFTMSKKLNNISKERICSEFCKIMSCKNSETLAVLLCTFMGIFASIIPEFKDCIGFEQNNVYHEHDVYFHTVHAIRNCKSNDLVTRLAILFHDIGKPHCYQDDPDGTRHFKGHGKESANITDEITNRLRFDNATRYHIRELVYFHDATIEAQPKHIKRWLRKMDYDQFCRLLDVRIADIKGQKSDIDMTRIDKIEKARQMAEAILLSVWMAPRNE